MQITNMKTEREDITTDLMNIKRIIKKYYKLYAHKLYNLNGMYQFFAGQNLSKLKQMKQKIWEAYTY